jgi:hypothetical protein
MTKREDDTRGAVLNEKNLVPLRWLVVTVGAAVSCFASSLYFVFSAGSLISALSLGQSGLVRRVDIIEADRESLGREILQRISVVETTQKLILRNQEEGKK